MPAYLCAVLYAAAAATSIGWPCAAVGWPASDAAQGDPMAHWPGRQPPRPGTPLGQRAPEPPAVTGPALTGNDASPSRSARCLPAAALRGQLAGPTPRATAACPDPRSVPGSSWAPGQNDRGSRRGARRSAIPAVIEPCRARLAGCRRWSRAQRFNGCHGQGVMTDNCQWHAA